MAAITIRNLDPSVVSALKKRALEHGRSMEEEVRETLNDALFSSTRKEGVIAQMRAFAKRRGPAKGPKGADIIRQERHGRTKRVLGK